MDKIMICNSMENLLETFEQFLGSEESGTVLAEKQRINLTIDTKKNMVSCVRSLFRFFLLNSLLRSYININSILDLLQCFILMERII